MAAEPFFPRAEAGLGIERAINGENAVQMIELMLEQLSEGVLSVEWSQISH